MPAYTEITEKHIGSLSLESRKALGQYMTPASIGDVMADMLDLDPASSPDVLDPACGTGELLLAVQRACPNAHLFGFDIDEGMVDAARENVPDSNIRLLSIFDEASVAEHGKYDYVIGNPPYFEMKKDDPDLASSAIEGFAALSDKGRLNIYSLFVEYAMRLVRVGGKVSFLVPPSMNNGAFFKELRRRVLELGVVRQIRLVRENDSFEDALTSVQILLLERTDDGYEKNLKASSAYVHDTGSTIIFTDRKDVIEKFAKGRASIGSQGFSVKTGTVVWNKYKGDFAKGNICSSGGVERTDGKQEKAPGSDMVPVLFAKDISVDNKLVLSDKVSAPGHWLPDTAARVDKGPAIIVNRIVGSLDAPRLRFAYVDLDRFYGENHVNVITREDGDAVKMKQLFDILSAIESSELSSYLQAVTGNTQLSATELGEMPVAKIS